MDPPLPTPSPSNCVIFVSPEANQRKEEEKKEKERNPSCFTPSSTFPRGVRTDEVLLNYSLMGEKNQNAKQCLDDYEIAEVRTFQKNKQSPLKTKEKEKTPFPISKKKV